MVVQFSFVISYEDTLHAESPSIFLDKSGRGRSNLGRSSKETLRAGYYEDRSFKTRDNSGNLATKKPQSYD